LGHTLKAKLQLIARRLGYRISRAERFPNLDLPFDILEYVVYKHLMTRSEFFFVQIGSDDSMFCENLNQLIMKYQLPGLIIEGNPVTFSIMKKRYEDQPQLSLLNCEVGVSDSELEIIHYREDAPAPKSLFNSIANMYGACIKHRKTQKHLNCIVESLKIPIKSFDDIQKEFNLTEVSMLNVDMGGLNKAFIQCTFNARCFPSIINYIWIKMSDKERYELKMMLLDNDYLFLDIGTTTLCVLVRA
jgi:FkbM family methyltransferase